MGLDIVELILAVEDAFQIHIADEEASTASTVGDLYDLVVAKVQGQDSKRCLTSAAFYRTRRAIVDTLAIDRRKVRPSTPLEVILPRDGRRETWRSIQAATGLTVPGLQPKWSTLLSLLAMGVITAMAPGIYARVGFVWIVLLFFLGIVLGSLLIKFSPALAVEFPNDAATVGDLARDVLAINHARLVEEVGGGSKKDLWDSLCRVIVIQTSVPAELITPEARIVGDLGLD